MHGNYDKMDVVKTGTRVTECAQYLRISEAKQGSSLVRTRGEDCLGISWLVDVGLQRGWEMAIQEGI